MGYHVIFGYLSLALSIYTAFVLYRRSRATICTSSAVFLAILCSTALLTWAVALASAVASSKFSTQGVFFAQLVSTTALLGWIYKPSYVMHGEPHKKLLSTENIRYGCAAALVSYCATFPHFLPAWGNVDFAQHVAMVDSLKHTLLDLPAHSISFGDWQKSYPYQFGFHFLNAFFSILLPFDTLTVMHASIAIIYGLLILAVLELSECKNRTLKLTLVCASFFISPFHAFIRLGWAPHFFATAISLFAFALFKFSAQFREHDTKLHFFTMISMLWLSSAAYPFCGLAAGMGLCWYHLQATTFSVQRAASLAGLCFVVLLPLMLQPILMDTLTVAFSKIFRSGNGEYYHALRVGSSEALVSPMQWAVFGILLLYSVATYKTARSTAFIAYILLLIVFSLLLGSGAYIVDKVLHTTWPIVIATLAHLAESACNLVKLKPKLKVLAYILPAVLCYGVFTYFFKLDHKFFAEKREPFLTREELAAVRLVQHSKSEYRILILGFSGSKEFLIRHMLQDGVWHGPFHRENYHISGACENACAEKEIQKFHIYSGKKVILAGASSFDIEGNLKLGKLRVLRKFKDFVLLEPAG